MRVASSEEYLEALLEAIRPGTEEVLAFYDHRVGVIGTDARLMLMPWDDHLVHRGDGVFESLKYEGRKLYQLDAHIRRMKISCQAIHLEPPCSWKELEESIIEVAAAGNEPDGLVRVLLGRGPGGFGLDPYESPVQSMYVVAYRMHKRPESSFEKGVTAMRTSIPAKQAWMATVKTTNYLPNVLMKREAVNNRVDFPLCFDDNGFLAEGATENVALVDDAGRLVIPEFTNSLAGTTLMRAVDMVKDDMPIIFKGVTEDEVYTAREVMMVGTSFDAIGIVRYNNKPIFDARPGPVTKKLRALLQADLQKNGLVF
ncbi:MAG TPA: aminotransferase class IV [Humidesulfovibrio sp.]|uniref:aminotransferase class IV n=1 Tax=Humidesulfovibrio sp. TaxID=2910988 RepID=UPI002BD638FB|nr:aminotransferase class IV [Humidesulfovibrio sp.]HWR03955.1 aminotransferase class IV [Humidesulfovibrio sp.]